MKLLIFVLLVTGSAYAQKQKSEGKVRPERTIVFSGSDLDTCYKKAQALTKDKIKPLEQSLSLPEGTFSLSASVYPSDPYNCLINFKSTDKTYQLVSVTGEFSYKGEDRGEKCYEDSKRLETQPEVLGSSYFEYGLLSKGCSVIYFAIRTK